MTLLAIETSTNACSVALMTDQHTLTESFEIAPQQHSQIVLERITLLLKATDKTLADLQAIAFGQGPGSFTGVRIAASITQGLAFSLGLSVIPISSLAALAQGCYRTQGHTHVLAAIDARMDEIYWATFIKKDQLVALEGQEQLIAPEKAAIATSAMHLTPWYGTGNGWAFQSRIAVCISHYDASTYPHAHDIALLAWPLYQQKKMRPAHHAQPTYLRNNVAQQKMRH